MNTYQNDSDRIVVAKLVFYKIVDEVIMENKSLFVGKTYLNLKGDKTTKVEFVGNSVNLTIDVNVKYGKNIAQLAQKLQDDAKLMVEHITGFKVAKIDVNIVGMAA